MDMVWHTAQHTLPSLHHPQGSREDPPAATINNSLAVIFPGIKG